MTLLCCKLCYQKEFYYITRIIALLIRRLCIKCVSLLSQTIKRSELHFVVSKESVFVLTDEQWKDKSVKLL